MKVMGRFMIPTVSLSDMASAALLHRRLLVPSLLAVLLVTAACGSSKSGSADDSAAAKAKVAAFTCPDSASSAGAAKSGPINGSRLQIVTTVAPITSIVAEIAGDKADVVGAIPEGQDSHTYEPKPSVAELVSKADVVFVNGLKLEDPTKSIAERYTPKGSQVIGLGTLTLSPDEYIYDFSFPKAGGKPNPHLWTNPPMAGCYATIAASVLSKADPANAAYYATNLKAFTAKVDELDGLMKQATAGMPANARKLLTYHDAYAYFAAHYGWDVIGAIQVSSFEDPTPKEVANLIEQIKVEKVPAIFGSEVFPSSVLAQIGRETGVKYVDKLRDDDLPGAPGDADHSYLGLMKFDFTTMVSSLGGDAAKLSAFETAGLVHDSATYPQ
jgi:ABC-type Zn uptake system ZnuABC Zn-binding protein ZnuA